MSVDFENSLDFAKAMDAKDPLSGFRSQFHFPRQEGGEPYLYLCGNSLGLQPKTTAGMIQEELEDWQRFGVEGHFYVATKQLLPPTHSHSQP